MKDLYLNITGENHLKKAKVEDEEEKRMGEEEWRSEFGRNAVYSQLGYGCMVL